jgi:hypothetical protein
MQVGSLAMKAIKSSRVIRRRRTTAPAVSAPARLQLFLPRSIPRTAIGVLEMTTLVMVNSFCPTRTCADDEG